MPHQLRVTSISGYEEAFVVDRGRTWKEGLGWNSIRLVAFHSTKYSGNSGWGSEWNRHFPEFHSRHFGCTSRGWPKIPENRNNRKIQFHSIIPARPSFSEPGNRTQHDCPRLIHHLFQLQLSSSNSKANKKGEKRQRVHRLICVLLFISYFRAKFGTR